MPKSDEYRSPVKLFEYALCDRPVIAPNQLPVLEVMEDQIHGLIVSADENEISKAIVHLLKNKLVAEELAGNWRKKVMNYHTWRQNAIKALMLAPQNTAVPKS
jgi:glycosyltransferase involved in cell wall biosynthesis